MIVGYVDQDGVLVHYQFSFNNLPLGSRSRAARCAELDRQLEALQDQGAKCGVWTLEDWARGWGNTLLKQSRHRTFLGSGRLT